MIIIEDKEMDFIFAKQKILIVDDMKANIQILADLLKDKYKILVATSGEKALEIAFSENKPDLILLDVIMPGMSGHDVCKKLKDSPKTKNIPIIFITGKVSIEDEIYGFELGAVDYIAKPFSPIIVKARVKTHAELKHHRDYFESISYIDGLTGIYNRRKFDEHLRHNVSMCAKSEGMISLIMMDIDCFKAFNDLYGHQEGDECLRKIANLLNTSISGNNGFFARYGGEEFACVFAKKTKDEVFEIAKALKEDVETLQIPNRNSSVKPFVTISIGISSIVPTDKTTCEEIIQSADKQLYISKTTGRNKVSAIEII